MSTSSPGPRDNLPLQLTRFVGRDAERARLHEALAEQRLITLVGTGGVGKTRLALEVARVARDQFSGGVCLVELAPLAEPDLVEQAVAALLGVRAELDVPLVHAIGTFLRERELLLVLDNCEHLVAPCAYLADALLRACPSLRILATSREPLRIAGEWTYRLAPLPVPEVADPVPEGLLEYAAIRLFVDRAAATAGFELTQAVAPTVIRVCQRVEGIPLALKLAAARVPALGLRELAARLDDALRLLTEGSRTAPARHQTLQATMDWSYELLSEAEQRLLERLSVFAGGFTFEAAEATAGAEDGLEMLLPRLVDRSLVVAEPDRHGSVRYHLLEVVRQYARMRLHERGDADSAWRRHAGFFLELVQTAERGVLRHDRERWQDRLELELDNLRGARTWFTAQSDAESSLRLNAYLYLLLAYRGYAGEGRASLREALALPGGSPAIRGRALHCLALLAYLQADYAAAAEYGERSLTLRREVGDPGELGWSLLERGSTACAQADFPRATKLLQEACDATRSGRAMYVHSYSLALLGSVDLLRGELAQARQYAGAALELADRHGFVAPASHALASLGEVDQLEGRYLEAASRLEAALERGRTPGEAYLVTRPMLGLALIAVDQRDMPRARELLVESLKTSQRLGNLHRIAQSLERVAVLAAREGAPDAAGQFVGAAEAVRERIMAPLAPVEERLLRERVGHIAASAAYTEGRHWVVDRAVRDALAYLEHAAPLHIEGSPLTTREREVADLVAEGMTNREIAQRLTIAERTVTSHIEHVLNKLGFRSRSQIAVWVTAQRHPLARNPGLTESQARPN